MKEVCLSHCHCWRMQVPDTCTLQVLRVPGQVEERGMITGSSVNSQVVSFVAPQNPSQE